MSTCSGRSAHTASQILKMGERDKALERTIKRSEEWYDRRRLAGGGGGQDAHAHGLIRFRITRRIGSVTWFRSE
jgi:hypothetical protein